MPDSNLGPNLPADRASAFYTLSYVLQTVVNAPCCVRQHGGVVVIAVTASGASAYIGIQ
jgi:hypothetical protein